jgi:hypothetical protein
MRGLGGRRLAVLKHGHAGSAVTRAKLKLLLEEYGRVAIWVYLVIWLTVLAGFAIAISAGFNVNGGPAGMGVLGAAWVATKLTQPLRIGATLLLTPAVAAVHIRWRGRAKAPPEQDPTP